MQKQIEIDILVRSKKWQKIENIEKFIEKTCKKLILETNLKDFLSKKPNHLQISISLLNDAQIKKINNQFRQKNKATDVLSFPFLDEKLLKKKDFFKNLKTSNIFLGDIALSLETIENEARSSEKNFKHHLTHLLLHSILHLLGFDHEEKKEALLMETTEIKILEKLGIKNPYKC